MATRSFTVFKDAPSPVKPSKPRPLRRAASSAAILANSKLPENSPALPMSSSSSEKENTHPVTGLGAGARPPLGKKRKVSEGGCGGVLATKMIAVAASASDAKATGNTKPKAPLQTRVDLKRKALSDAGSDKTKLKRGSLKDGGSRSSNTSLVTTRRTRSTTKLLLETIKEEVVTTEKEGSKKQDSLKQVLINSKCRDLTVSPLADVTGAYTQSADSVEKKAKEEVESALPSEDAFFSSKIRDYFAPEGPRKAVNRRPLSASSSFTLFDACGPRASDPVTPTKRKGLSRSMSMPAVSPSRSGSLKLGDDNEDVRSTVLTTPERKELYASFTFSSPIRS